MGCITTKYRDNNKKTQLHNKKENTDTGPSAPQKNTPDKSSLKYEGELKSSQEKREALHYGILNNNLLLCQKVLKSINKLDDIVMTETEFKQEGEKHRYSTYRMPLLHLACMCRRPEIIFLLLRKGADVMAIDESGRSPAHTTLCYWPRVIPRRPQSIEKLNEVGKSFWNNIDDQNRRLEKCLRFLMESRANPSEVVNDAGQTLLHICAKKELPIAMDVLLKYKAKLELKDVEGLTPLVLAANFSYFTCVKKLLEYGADISACTAKGSSLLHLLCDSRKISVDQIRELIPFGILKFVKVRCTRGYTPLHMAARSCSCEKIQLLLAHDSDANVFDNYGRQPLYLFLDSSFYRRSLLGAHELLTEMTQICLKNENGLLPHGMKPTTEKKRIFNGTFIEHSANASSLYKLSMQKVRYVLGRNRQTPGHVAQLPLPDSMVSEILMYREKSRAYWESFFQIVTDL